MVFYPVFLNLKGRRVVVIGGGEVAERKIETLLETGASVRVVSPEVTERIETLAQSGRVHLARRNYAAGDCEGAAIVLSASDDPAVSVAVFEEGTRAGALVNTADQPELCDFIMPAVVRRGDIAIAISTGGASPGLAAQLRRKIEKTVGPEYEKLAKLLAEIRPEIRRRVPDAQRRKALHQRILSSDIIDCLKRNDSAGARRRLNEIMKSPQNSDDAS